MAARSRLEPNRQLVGISSLRIPALLFGDRPPRPFPPAPEVRFAHDSALEADVLSGDGQGPAGLSTVKEEHQAHGRKSPRADRPSGYLAGDHKAGGSVEPGAPRMGQLL